VEIRYESIGPITLIKPMETYLDAARAKSFRKDVVDRLAPESRVILDLGNLRFIDSSGCGVLLACSRRLNPDGNGPGDIKVCGVTKQLRTVFEMVRLHKVLDIYNNREEALRAFDAASAASASER